MATKIHFDSSTLRPMWDTAHNKLMVFVPTCPDYTLVSTNFGTFNCWGSNQKPDILALTISGARRYSDDSFIDELNTTHCLELMDMGSGEVQYLKTIPNVYFDENQDWPEGYYTICIAVGNYQGRGGGILIRALEQGEECQDTSSIANSWIFMKELMGYNSVCPPNSYNNYLTSTTLIGGVYTPLGYGGSAQLTDPSGQL